MDANVTRLPLPYEVMDGPMLGLRGGFAWNIEPLWVIGEGKFLFAKQGKHLVVSLAVKSAI